MKYVLKKPIKVGKEGETLTELHIREEICTGDLRGVKLGSLIPAEMPADVLALILGRLSGQDSLVMEGMAFEDLNEVGPKVLGFLFPGPKTGTTP